MKRSGRLAVLALLLAAVYGTAAFTDWVPALSRLRDLYIETALSTMRHQWLADALFPDEAVQRVREDMEADRLAQQGQNSGHWDTDASPENRDFFELFPELDKAAFLAWASVPEEGLDEFYVNSTGPDQPGLDLYTRQGDQVLAIDAKNGLLVLRIREDWFRGVLILGKDPSRLTCVHGDGQTAGDIARTNNGLVAMTASGFDADGPEGKKLTGAAMCGGTVFGEHLKPGYKRLELRSDDRLYIVDAPTPFHPDCTDAAEWTPALIVDGEIAVTEEDHYNVRNPRCCLGQAKDGSVLMLCIEGRYLDSLGATAPECAAILQRYGAYQAMNMDGGSSAVCWYQGQVITRCADPDRPEGRLLPNAWIYRGN